MPRTRQQIQQEQEQEEKKTVENRKPVCCESGSAKPRDQRPHLLIARVFSSDMVLQKGRAASQHLLQTRIAECLVGEVTDTILFTARKDQEVVHWENSSRPAENATLEQFDEDDDA